MANVLLLGPWTMPQVAAWRGVLADVAGSCTLATLHPGVVPAEERAHTIDLRAGRTFGAAFLGAIRELRRLDAAKRFDSILAYYVTSYGSLAALAFPGRFVAVAAGSDIDPTRLRIPRRLVARLALRRADRAAAWTPIMAERLRELGMSPDRIRTGPRGIDLTIYHPADQVHPESEPITIVTTRRLRPVFRHDVLLRALRRLADRGIAARVDFVGSGSDRERLEALARDLGLSDLVRFWGTLPPGEVAERLRASHAFVSLSRKDGLSTSLVEALACGTVPIVSDIPPNLELVRHGENGVVVGGDDPDEVADAVLRSTRDAGFRRAARNANISLTRRSFDVRRNTSGILRFAGLSDLASGRIVPEDDGVLRSGEDR